MDCIMKNRNQIAKVQKDFEACDRLGRSVGAMVTCFEADFSPYVHKEGEYNSFWQNQAPGRVFFFRMSATRNGKAHQADHKSDFFRDREAMDSAVVKYFEAARKRSLKAHLKA